MKKLILILLIFSSISLYSEDFWEYLYGPNSGAINVVKINYKNGNIFIGTANGVFKSINNGKSWIHVYKGESIQNIFISNNGTILISEIKMDVFLHIYLSNDDGTNWEELKTLILKPYPFGFQFTKDNTVIIIKYNLIDTISTSYSFNFGNIWKSNIYILDTAIHFNISCSKIDLNGNKIALGGYYKINNEFFGIILTSNDTGKTWHEINGLPNMKYIEFITDDYILADTGHGLFITTDRGKTWNNTIFTKEILCIYKDYDNTIYLSYVDGLYASYDNGINWKFLSFQNVWFHCLISDDQGILYGSSYGTGFYYSTDKGYNWIQSNKGFTADDVKAITFDKDGNIYTVSYGVYKSTDNGDSWECLGLKDKYLTAITINNKGDIFTSSNSEAYGIFRSTDNGKTWGQLTEGMITGMGTPPLVKAIFVNKRGHIYIGSENSDGYWLSKDNGVAWKREIQPGFSCSFSFNSKGDILRGGRWREIYMSKDDGDTWFKVNDGNPNYQGIISLIVIYKDGYGYTYDYASRTEDDGASWNTIYGNENKVGIYAFDSLGALYSIYWGSEIWRYSRSEDKREEVSSGLFHTSFNTIAVAPNGYIYLAAEYGGLYRSKQKFVSVQDNHIPSNNLILKSSPNPFSESTTIKYSLPSPSHVKLSIYDIFGREVAVLVEGWQDIGEHIEHLPFNIYQFGNGIYFCKLQAGGETKVIKIVKIE